jgi:hypothetical protein
MANIFQAVRTYQKASLGRLLNLMVFGSTMNPKFKQFNEDYIGNLGDSITFDLPPRFYAASGLVVNTFDSVEQRVDTLSVNVANNVNFQVTNQEQIFNLEPLDYMEEFGNSAMDELASKIESDLAGALLTNTYRFFGDGVNQINSFQQLIKANTFYRNYGAPKGDLKVYIQDLAVPEIVASGLNQFVTKRNEDLAQSWELGSYNNATYYASNLLATHTAGTVGQAVGTAANILTVVSTNDPTGANITQITFSSPTANSSDAVVTNDLMQFLDNVSGQPNIRYRTFTGHEISSNPVQLRVTADADIVTNAITVSIYPALRSLPGKNQNLSTNIVAGMQVKVLPSHKRGMILGGDAFYLAMPKLPDQRPFDTANHYAEDYPLAIRMTYGALFGQNSMGVIYDEIHGKKLVDEYAMAMIFPL